MKRFKAFVALATVLSIPLMSAVAEAAPRFHAFR